MRRLLLVAWALLLGAAGCSEASGSSDSAAPSAPSASTSTAAEPKDPAVGDCWTTTAYEASDALAFDFTAPVDCAAEHHMETVHVGRITGTLAAGAEVPARTDFAPLYAECEKAAETYLGAAWHTGQVYVYMHPPTIPEWRAGVRSFRCDVAAVDLQNNRLVPVKETFKDSLRPGSPRTIGCAKRVVSGGRTTNLAPVACTEPHYAEFVGFARRTDVAEFPTEFMAFANLFDAECERQALAYTGMSRSHASRTVGALPFRTTTGIGWQHGDRSARCYVTAKGKELGRSLKGVGNVSL
ncbi:septum formation family protein [Dactylosporangium sucinum]|uniref:Septum formation-related domain-containing protein n=1 Tax=Dactylosporangium sucinum TaxID=1424081 RepID=A0A917X5C3_9ACTN|nr:septum formation family protein [Dactylosporangium sucinum]GGM68630.1 hypothetical protein GCM10007977_082990 [Dactylosporangium sucinum]